MNENEQPSEPINLNYEPPRDEQDTTFYRPEESNAGFLARTLAKIRQTFVGRETHIDQVPTSFSTYSDQELDLSEPARTEESTDTMPLEPDTMVVDDEGYTSLTSPDAVQQYARSADPRNQRSEYSDPRQSVDGPINRRSWYAPIDSFRAPENTIDDSPTGQTEPIEDTDHLPAVDQSHQEYEHPVAQMDSEDVYLSNLGDGSSPAEPARDPLDTPVLPPEPILGPDDTRPQT